MSLTGNNLFNFDNGILQKDAFIVIVRTEWNADIVNKLTDGCTAILDEYEMHNYKLINVPGAFEIPFAIKSFWENSAFQRPDAFIALGCVLRGDTPHFDYVCKAVTDGIVQLNLMLSAPTIFGILTVDNQSQADERTNKGKENKGGEAAITALKMMALNYSFHSKSKTI